MDIDLYSRFILALCAVLALLLLCGWLARRLGFGGRPLGTRAGRRLAVIEVTPLDAKRRLVLVRRDNVEHLVLLGTESALLIEQGIGTGTPFATLVEASKP